MQPELVNTKEQLCKKNLGSIHIVCFVKFRHSPTTMILIIGDKSLCIEINK